MRPHSDALHGFIIWLKWIKAWTLEYFIQALGALDVWIQIPSNFTQYISAQPKHGTLLFSKVTEYQNFITALLFIHKWDLHINSMSELCIVVNIHVWKMFFLIDVLLRIMRWSFGVGYALVETRYKLLSLQNGNSVAGTFTLLHRDHVFQSGGVHTPTRVSQIHKCLRGLYALACSLR